MITPAINESVKNWATRLKTCHFHNQRSKQDI